MYDYKFTYDYLYIIIHFSFLSLMKSVIPLSPVIEDHYYEKRYMDKYELRLIICVNICLLSNVQWFIHLLPINWYETRAYIHLDSRQWNTNKPKLTGKTGDIFQ